MNSTFKERKVKIKTIAKIKIF